MARPITLRLSGTASEAVKRRADADQQSMNTWIQKSPRHRRFASTLRASPPGLRPSNSGTASWLATSAHSARRRCPTTAGGSSQAQPCRIGMSSVDPAKAHNRCGLPPSKSGRARSTGTSHHTVMDRPGPTATTRWPPA